MQVNPSQLFQGVDCLSPAFARLGTLSARRGVRFCFSLDQRTSASEHSDSSVLAVERLADFIVGRLVIVTDDDARAVRERHRSQFSVDEARDFSRKS